MSNDGITRSVIRPDHSMEDQCPSGSPRFRVRPFPIGDLTRWFESQLPLPAEGPLDSGPLEVVRTFLDVEIPGSQNAWIVESAGRIIGVAVVQIENDVLAHLKHVWVAPDAPNHRHVASTLAATAIRDTWEYGYLKLVVHTAVPASRLVASMHELGFEFARAHSMGGEPVVEFYRNLYERPGTRCQAIGTPRMRS